MLCYGRMVSTRVQYVSRHTRDFVDPCFLLPSQLRLCPFLLTTTMAKRLRTDDDNDEDTTPCKKNRFPHFKDHAGSSTSLILVCNTNVLIEAFQEGLLPVAVQQHASKYSRLGHMSPVKTHPDISDICSIFWSRRRSLKPSVPFRTSMHQRR